MPRTRRPRGAPVGQASGAGVTSHWSAPSTSASLIGSSHQTFELRMDCEPLLGHLSQRPDIPSTTNARAAATRACARSVRRSGAGAAGQRSRPAYTRLRSSTRWTRWPARRSVRAARPRSARHPDRLHELVDAPASSRAGVDYLGRSAGHRLYRRAGRPGAHLYARKRCCRDRGAARLEGASGWVQLGIERNGAALRHSARDPGVHRVPGCPWPRSIHGASSPHRQPG